MQSRVDSCFLFKAGDGLVHGVKEVKRKGDIAIVTEVVKDHKVMGPNPIKSGVQSNVFNNGVEYIPQSFLMVSVTKKVSFFTSLFISSVLLAKSLMAFVDSFLSLKNLCPSINNPVTSAITSSVIWK